MSPLNRRDFLKGGSMAVAAAGVVSAMPMALPALAGTAGATTTSDGADDNEVETGGQLDQPLVAHVRDLETGEIGIFFGETEVVHKDRKLAAQIHRAAT